MLSLRIALRYLFSKKSHNAVNILSIVSVVGVAIATTAMVIVLSVFNGFSDLASSQLSRIDPDLLVAPPSGKIIPAADSLAERLGRIDGVAVAAPMLSEQALAMKRDMQMPVTLIGMTPEGVEATRLADITIDGEAMVDVIDMEGSPLDGFPTTMLSVGVANGIGLDGFTENFIRVYVPKRRGRINTANPMTAFRGDTLLVAGVYRVDQSEYDADVMIVPLTVARRLLDYRHGEASGVRITVDAGSDVDAVRQRLEEAVDGRYDVLDRYEQQRQAFSMISIEKWITLLILVFILIITAFNIVSAVYILRVEKAGNMAVLRAMGAMPRQIKAVFSWQGRLITLAGGLAGIAVGSALVLVQQYLGVIKLYASDSAMLVVDAYPVRLAPADLAVVAAIIIITAFTASYIATLGKANETQTPVGQ